MTIEFSCQHCGKALSTSDDKAGRKAKCPGCGEAVLVPAPVSAGEDDLDYGVDDAQAVAGEDITCPMCGAKNASRAKTCESCGEPLHSRSRGNRPVQAGTFEIGRVVSRSWEIFKQEMGLVVGGQICAGLLSTLAFIPMIGVAFGAFAADEQGQKEVMAVLFAVACAFGIAAGLCSLWIDIGLHRLLLGVVRGDEVSLRTLFAGGKYLGRWFVCHFLYNIVMQVGLNLCLIPGLFVYLFCWPFAYLLIDDDPPHVQALSDSVKLSSQCLWNSFLLLIVTLGVLLMGLCALFVGLFFAIPFVMLMWCVAYDELRHGTSAART